MKAPKFCPVCNNILLNLYTSTLTCDTLNMYCLHNVSHQLSYNLDDKDEVKLLNITIYPYTIQWCFKQQKVYVNRNYNSLLNVIEYPWFEPCYNLRLLFDKIDKLMIFLP